MKYLKKEFIAAGIILLLTILFFIKLTFERVRYNSARTRMLPIESAIDKFHLNTNYYPVSLKELIYDFEYGGPLLRENQTLDPWDRVYIYNVTNDGYELISYGADGLPGGEGYDADIYND